MSTDGREAVFRLADYVTAFRPGPGELRSRTRLAVLDTIGCMVGAATTPTGEMIVDAVAEMAVQKAQCEENPTQELHWSAFLAGPKPSGKKARKTGGRGAESSTQAGAS